jgi:lipopolysaccharide-induced tumor necrosis factor-alpha factor
MLKWFLKAVSMDTATDTYNLHRVMAQEKMRVPGINVEEMVPFWYLSFKTDVEVKWVTFYNAVLNKLCDYVDAHQDVFDFGSADQRKVYKQQVEEVLLSELSHDGIVAASAYQGYLKSKKVSTIWDVVCPLVGLPCDIAWLDKMPEGVMQARGLSNSAVNNVSSGDSPYSGRKVPPPPPTPSRTSAPTPQVQQAYIQPPQYYVQPPPPIYVIQQAPPPPPPPLEQAQARAISMQEEVYAADSRVRVTNLGPTSCVVDCPYCNTSGKSRIKKTYKGSTWCCCVTIALFGGFMGCCLIPFCVAQPESVVHTCRTCNKVVGRY